MGTAQFLLFVTAPNADYKTFNRLLTNLQDCVYNDDESQFDAFHLLTTRDPEILIADDLEGTCPGDFDAENSANAWAGASFAEVEDFVRGLYPPGGAKEEEEEEGEGARLPPKILKHSGLFLVLDEQGLAEETVILANRHYFWEDEEEEEEEEEDEKGEEKKPKEDDRALTDEARAILSRLPREKPGKPITFDKLRLPWLHTWSMAANLEIANMDFLDFCRDEDEHPPTADRFWQYNAEAFPDDDECERREKVLARLEGEGKI